MNEHVKTCPRDNWGIQAQDAPIIRDTEEPPLGRGVTGGVASGFGHVSPPPTAPSSARASARRLAGRTTAVPGSSGRSRRGRLRGALHAPRHRRGSVLTVDSLVRPSRATGPARPFRHHGSSMGFAAASDPGREGRHRAGHGGFRVVQDSEGHEPASGARDGGGRRPGEPPLCSDPLTE